MTDDFAGKVAVVTGASGGMGTAIISRLADLNTTIYAIDVKTNPVANPKRNILPVQCDISDPEAVRQTASDIVAETGHVDFLVNGAGLVSATRPVEAIADADWALLMGVNLNGAFHWMREVLPAMKARRFGKIVNVASRAGRTVANFAGAHYSASKAGLLGLTRQVALESAPHNVHVNAIAPGLVDTPMLSSSVDASRREAARHAIPLRRIGTTDDIAELVLFLLSPRSDYITGATMDINGGDLIL